MIVRDHPVFIRIEFQDSQCSGVSLDHLERFDLVPESLNCFCGARTLRWHFELLQRSQFVRSLWPAIRRHGIGEFLRSEFVFGRFPESNEPRNRRLDSRVRRTAFARSNRAPYKEYLSLSALTQLSNDLPSTVVRYGHSLNSCSAP